MPLVRLFIVPDFSLRPYNAYDAHMTTRTTSSMKTATQDEHHALEIPKMSSTYRKRAMHEGTDHQRKGMPKRRQIHTVSIGLLGTWDGLCNY